MENPTDINARFPYAGCDKQLWKCFRIFCYDALHCVTLSVWKCIASATAIFMCSIRSMTEIHYGSHQCYVTSELALKKKVIPVLYLYFNVQGQYKRAFQRMDVIDVSIAILPIWIDISGVTNCHVTFYIWHDTADNSAKSGLLSPDLQMMALMDVVMDILHYIWGHILSCHLSYDMTHTTTLQKVLKLFSSDLQRMALMDVAMAMIPSLLLPVSFVWDVVSFWSENWHFVKVLEKYDNFFLTWKDT